jgi:hypothetical protein
MASHTQRLLRDSSRCSARRVRGAALCLLTVLRKHQQGVTQLYHQVVTGVKQQLPLLVPAAAHTS